MLRRLKRLPSGWEVTELVGEPGRGTASFLGEGNDANIWGSVQVICGVS